MVDDQREILSCEHRNLSDQVISEYDLCIILGISAVTLDNLRRQKDLPYIVLNRNNRVYLVSEVLKWLASLPKA